MSAKNEVQVLGLLIKKEPYGSTTLSSKQVFTNQIEVTMEIDQSDMDTKKLSVYQSKAQQKAT